MMTEKIKYFSMFSGIGGFEVGMEKSRHKFECVGYSEIDKWADSIYSYHFPKHKNWGDATQLDTREIPSFDLLVGGFPCQAFSIAGKRKGFNDCRGTLFFEIARVLSDKRPKYFLLENVKNLLSHNNGETFATILEVLAQVGYDVSWQIYNSANYGVPQKRERVFLKGYLGERCGREILDQPINCEEVMGMNPRQLNNHKKTYQDGRIYSDDGASITLNHKGNNGWYMLNSDEMINTTKKDNVYCLHSKYTASPFRKHQESYVVKDKMKIRKLTPVECERLQGFSDDYTKYGRDGELINDSQRYKCLGNAVTVNVVEYIMNNWDLKGE